MGSVVLFDVFSQANEKSASVTLCEQEVLSIAREHALDSLLYHRCSVAEHTSGRGDDQLPCSRFLWPYQAQAATRAKAPTTPATWGSMGQILASPRGGLPRACTPGAEAAEAARPAKLRSRLRLVL